MTNIQHISLPVSSKLPLESLTVHSTALNIKQYFSLCSMSMEKKTMRWTPAMECLVLELKEGIKDGTENCSAVLMMLYECYVNVTHKAVVYSQEKQHTSK